jgi:hypothetical protein
MVPAHSFGQQAAELPCSYTIEKDGTATVHVGQLPPNSNVFVRCILLCCPQVDVDVTAQAPGPALLFVLMDNVPSVAKYLLIGSGQIGEQPTAASVAIPATDNSAGIDPKQTKDNTSNNAAANAGSGADEGLSAGAKKGIIIGAIACVPLFRLRPTGFSPRTAPVSCSWLSALFSPGAVDPQTSAMSPTIATSIAPPRADRAPLSATRTTPCVSSLSLGCVGPLYRTQYANPSGYHSTANLNDAPATGGYRSQRAQAY